MPHPPQRRIPATYMRGGTSKGVFFRLQDLPAAAQAYVARISEFSGVPVRSVSVGPERDQVVEVKL